MRDEIINVIRWRFANETSSSIRDLIWSIIQLDDNDLLTLVHIDMIFNHKNPRILSDALIRLHRLQILTPDISDLLMKHEQTDALVDCICCLREANILSINICKVLIEYENLVDLSAALFILCDEFILSEYYFHHLINQDEPRGFAFIIRYLHRADNLTSNNIYFLLEHSDIDSLATALYEIERANVFSANIFNELISHPRIRNIAYLFQRLNEVGLLTIDVFSVIKHPACQELLDITIWELIETISFKNIWEDILASIRNQTFVQFVHYLLDLDNPDNDTVNEEQLNNRQSTHNTSVHQSISESAKRLWNRYGSRVELESQLKDIQAYVFGLKANIENAAAQRAIMRITNPTFSFEDPGSNLSILQLLAVAFEAIHDKSLLIGTLEDALAQFVKGLYEIQRGYNLSEDGKDLLGLDDPICTAGTFNKIIEKLIGIHPDCELRYITKKQASAKLHVVVIEEVLAFLFRYASPGTPEAFAALSAFICKLTQGVDCIWPSIKHKVSERLFDEFHILFEHKGNKEFIDLIEAGQYSSLQNLSVLQEPVSQSIGYRQALDQRMRYSAQFFSEARYLSERRHDNERLQHQYDRRFALI